MTAELLLRAKELIETHCWETEWEMSKGESVPINVCGDCGAQEGKDHAETCDIRKFLADLAAAKEEGSKDKQIEQLKDALQVAQAFTREAPALQNRVEVLIKIIDRLRPICGETMSEDDPPCTCAACKDNAKIDAALAPIAEGGG